MPRLIIASALGLVLGWGAAHALFLGWWTLLPWGLAALALGYRARKVNALLAGATYGFVLSFVFMLAGYTGAASVISRVPFFALLGLFGALCGCLLAALGTLLAPRRHLTAGSSTTYGS
jgi:hypothetical protein